MNRKIINLNQENRTITFETNVNGTLSNHQISIDEFDTAKKIEEEMDRVLQQVQAELQVTKNDDVITIHTDIVDLVKKDIPDFVLEDN